MVSRIFIFFVRFFCFLRHKLNHSQPSSTSDTVIHFTQQHYMFFIVFCDQNVKEILRLQNIYTEKCP